MLRQLLCACAVLLALSLAVVAEDAPAGEQPAEKPAAEKPAGPQVMTLDGTIKALTNMGPTQVTAMVVCTLTTADGEKKLELAPQAYLTEGGLTPKVGEAISVTILKKGAKYVVREITQDGKSLKVRDARGLALWSLFVGQPDVTITGKIVKVVYTEPEPKPQPKPKTDVNAATDANAEAAAPAEEKPPVDPKMITVSFRLENDKGAYRVSVGSKAAMDTLGFTLEEGATVTVAGWQMDVPAPKKGTDPAVAAARPKWQITLRAVTIGDKTYTLRDAATGKECWEPAPAPKSKPAKKK